MASSICLGVLLVITFLCIVTLLFVPTLTRAGPIITILLVITVMRRLESRWVQPARIEEVEIEAGICSRGGEREA
jgi:hypothetical protein